MGLDLPVFKAIDYMYAIPQNWPSMMRKYKKSVIKEKDIVYDSSNSKICKLDTYHVEKNDGKKYPIVLVIHGGGFVAGDKKYRKCISSWFAQEAGAYVFNVNYGLGPKYYFPDSIKHLTAAVNYIADNAERLNLDLSKFVATGDSAGGYYAAELCTIQDSKLQQEKLDCHPKAKITAVLLNCGIYDIDRALSAKVLFNLTGSVCKDFTGINVKDIQKYEYIDVISPLKHLTTSFPKACIIYAQQDFFCGGQGEDLVEKLNELGVYNEVYFSTKFGDNHTFPSTWKSKAAKEANALFLDFTKRFFDDKI